MPKTFQGIGTTYYGQRDFRPDGSYITTEFFVFAKIPLIPLRSVRLTHQSSSGTVFPVIHSEEHYLVLATTKPNFKQVMSIYGFSLFMASWVVMLGWSYSKLHGKINPTISSILLFSLFAIPALLPAVLRHLAKRKIKLQPNAAPTPNEPLPEKSIAVATDM